MSGKTILRLPAVMAHTGLGRSSIYAMIANSAFPKPISLGPRAIGWDSDEVQAWINSCIQASRSEAHQAAQPTR